MAVSKSIINYLLKNGVTQKQIDAADNDYQVKAMREHVKYCKNSNVDNPKIAAIENKSDYRDYRDYAKLCEMRNEAVELGVEQKMVDQVTNQYVLGAIITCKRDYPDAVIVLEDMQKINNRKKLEAFLEKIHPGLFEEKFEILGITEGLAITEEFVAIPQESVAVSKSIIRYLLKNGVTQKQIDAADNDYQVKAMREHVKYCKNSNVDNPKIAAIESVGDLRDYRNFIKLCEMRNMAVKLGVEQEIADQVTNQYVLRAMIEIKELDSDYKIVLKDMQEINTKKKLIAFIEEQKPLIFIERMEALGISQMDIDLVKGESRFVKKAFMVFKIYEKINNSMLDIAKIKTVTDEALLSAFDVASKCKVMFGEAKASIEDGKFNFTKFKEFIFNISEEQKQSLKDKNPAISNQLNQLFNHASQDYSDAKSVKLALNMKNNEDIAHYICQRVASHSSLFKKDLEKGDFILEVIKIIATRDDVDITGATSKNAANYIAKDKVSGISEQEINRIIHPNFPAELGDALDKEAEFQSIYAVLDTNVFNINNLIIDTYEEIDKDDKDGGIDLPIDLPILGMGE